MTEADLKVNHVYRAKRPAASGFIDRVYNDRQIIWIGDLTVQYDSPVIPHGQHYRRIGIQQFLKWADRDVTGEMPPNGQWAPWDK
jgi:hypothetical protein